MIGHSYFSMRYGVMSPITLCETFKDQGFPLGVLADVNSTSAIWDVFRWSRKDKFPMLTGVDVKNGVRTVYVAIPHNEQGWLEVNEWLS